MKTLSTVVLVLLATLMLGASHDTRARTSGDSGLTSFLRGADYHANVVRAEYYYSTTTNRLASTLCHISNTSATEPVVLKEVVLLGPDGAGSILTVFNGLVDHVVPPLGLVDLSIASNIPGLVRANENNPGVRRVVLIWVGSEDALEFNASIDSRATGNEYSRAYEMEQGYVVRF